LELVLLKGISGKKQALLKVMSIELAYLLRVGICIAVTHERRTDENSESLLTSHSGFP